MYTQDRLCFCAWWWGGWWLMSLLLKRCCQGITGREEKNRGGWGGQAPSCAGKDKGWRLLHSPHTLASTKDIGYCEYSSRPYTGRMEGSEGSQSLYWGTAQIPLKGKGPSLCTTPRQGSWVGHSVKCSKNHSQCRKASTESKRVASFHYPSVCEVETGGSPGAHWPASLA